MRPSHPTARTQHRQGFTLMEVLMVVAVISILVAIIIPALGGAQNSAKRAKTRVQFSQWSAAIEQFRQEYGYYPDFPNQRVNDGAFSDLATEHIFHDTLAGVRRNGTPLAATGTTPDPEAQNPKRIRFCSFSGDAISNDGLLQDAFGNTEIVVFVDRNFDGIVAIGTGTEPVQEHASFPATIAAADGSTVGPPSSVPALIRTGVAFYSAGDGQRPVTSW